MIKELVRKAFQLIGFEISKVSPNRFNPAYLAQISSPETVIDVGVGFGTEELYKAYPASRFILIEPLEDYKPAHAKIMKNYNCEVYYKGLGSRECTEEIEIDKDNMQLSSLKNRTSLTQKEHTTETRQVQITTLDNIFMPLYENGKIASPVLLKIDTEGYELEVLKGAEKTLQYIETLIMEISVAKRFEDSYNFEDIILFLKEHGFYVYSFLHMVHPKNELRTRLVEMAFKKVGPTA